MGAGQSLKRPYDEIDVNVEPTEHFLHQANEGTEVSESSQSVINAETEADSLFQRATRRSCDQDKVGTNVEESSKRLCFDKRRLLDPRHFSYMQHNDSPSKATHSSATRKPTLCDDDSIHSTSKAKLPQNLNFDPKRLLDPKAFITEWPKETPFRPLHPSLTNHNHPPKPNLSASLPPRPTFARLAADGQQGMKVLFLIDHATKGDAIHHAISAQVDPDSSEMVLLMRKYLSHRSSFQTRFFAKARTICAQLTSRFEFLSSLEPNIWIRGTDRMVHRVKRTLWRVEIFAVVSYVAPPSPNESAKDSEISEVYRAGAIGIAIPPGDDEGTCMLLASLYGTELAELESVYDYLWRETVEKAYQHKIDSYMAQHDKKVQQLQSEGKLGTTSRGLERSEQEHDKFRTWRMMKKNADRARKDHDRCLTYLMSLGLPFLHRVHLRLKQDGNEIIPENYPFRYYSRNGLRDIWNGMDGSRCDDIQLSYNRTLIYEKDDAVVNRQGSTRAAYCASYLQSQTSTHFRIEDLWRAGCYMWDGGRSVQERYAEYFKARGGY